MSVFMLTLIFYLRNFPLEQFGVRNVGYIEGEDMTSWLYFQKHFSAYLAGEIFPIPAPEEV
jgi:hypothetical protein